MPATTTEAAVTPDAAYMDAKTAARILGISKRRTLELAKDGGKIRRQESYNPRTGRRLMLLVSEDVERLAAKRKAQMEEAAAPRPEPPKPLLLPSPSRAWLTLAEAEALTGLPEHALARLIRTRKLRAIDCGAKWGKEHGGRWRVRRADLDAIEPSDLP